MMNELNNKKCAQWMLDCMDGIDLPNVRNTKYMPEWISVKDRLPPENIRVLLYDLITPSGMVGELVILKSSKWYWRTDKWRAESNQVSHWMTLPEPPKE